jgi:ATP-dependent DNA helicase RecG
LLTKSTTPFERFEILNGLLSGDIQILIGTHSILSNDVVFNKLTYAVIDEQHRFGVAQRAIIKQKGNGVDVLVMSATPIPRSLALVVYGNLDFSTLLSRPNATNITTNIVIKQKQLDMWNYIKNKLLTGSKVYVVCAKIDEENEDDDVLKLSAKNMYDYLSTIFDKSEVGLIHGKLKKDTQNKVIENFRLGKIKVLVSTTIVEVGVDVPDSDIMVIASPERFGLATLHQLRGRIGRNGNEAHCFCLADNLNEHSFERVNYFRNHLNGFDIAEFDLKTRGAGTMFGTNQHGVDTGIISNFSAETYNLAQKIFNEIKDDNNLISKLASRYAEKHGIDSKNNIVLN